MGEKHWLCASERFELGGHRSKPYSSNYRHWPWLILLLFVSPLEYTELYNTIGTGREKGFQYRGGWISFSLLLCVSGALLLVTSEHVREACKHYLTRLTGFTFIRVMPTAIEREDHFLYVVVDISLHGRSAAERSDQLLDQRLLIRAGDGLSLFYETLILRIDARSFVQENYLRWQRQHRNAGMLVRLMVRLIARSAYYSAKRCVYFYPCHAFKGELRSRLRTLARIPLG